MNRPRRSMPSCEEVTHAHRKLIPTLPNIWSPDDAHESCWGCGLSDPGMRPHRCHIVPRSRGGTFEPSNFLLLCTTCHREQPDGQPFEVQVAWLRSRESFLDRTWRLFKPILERLRERAAAAGSEQLLTDWIRETSATAAGSALVAFESIMRSGGRRAADQGFRAEVANGSWELLTAFDEWLQSRSEPQLALCLPDAPRHLRLVD